MALVVSKFGGDAGGPFKTGFGNLWWGRAKLTWTGGSTFNAATGIPIGNEFKTALGFSRLAHIFADSIGGDVGFATATGVCSGAIMTYIRSQNRIFLFGIGRAVNGGAGVPVPAADFASNGTSIDALTFLVQVYGFL